MEPIDTGPRYQADNTSGVNALNGDHTTALAVYVGRIHQEADVCRKATTVVLSTPADTSIPLHGTCLALVLPWLLFSVTKPNRS
jgi:hypothetical protein